MNILQAIILGVIQGLTEFLPISSSAHLVLAPYFLNWSIPEEQVFPFDVLVQLGTLLAVLIYFRKDLAKIIVAVVQGLIQRKPFENPDSRLGWYLALSAIPAGLAGLLIKDQVEAAFNSPVVTAIFLLITAVLLLVAESIGRRQRDLNNTTWIDALWIGAFQVLSLFPGVSRSGSTIAGGMTRNFQRESAARFSFLMSIPVFFGAGLIGVLDLAEVPNLSTFLPTLAAGFIAAALVGYAAIAWLLNYLNRKSLRPFAIYCAALALVTLLVAYVSNSV
jgi:undecaprenyl-diphosphatase